MTRSSLALVAVVAGALSSGCAVPRQMFAAPDDLADYRAFCVAAHEGRRLFEAQRYLDRHPDGAWAKEVRAVFDEEEAAWFEAAKTSRVKAREYIVDLPQGPHVEAARSLLVLFDEHQDDAEILELLSAARHTAATLDYETGRRHRVSDVILAEIAALAEPQTWGARLEAPPATLAAALRGEVAHTWGGAPHAQRKDALFFVVPTPSGSEPSVAEVTFQLWLDHGTVSEGLVQGDNLFVRWAEAQLVRILDPGNPANRTLAASTVTDVLSGAFEAILPAARCTSPLQAGEILARSCDGWNVSARMGPRDGTGDVIDVRGPRQGAGTPDGAHSRECVRGVVRWRLQRRPT